MRRVFGPDDGGWEEGGAAGDARQERWAGYAIALLAVYAVGRAAVVALGKPLWFDEIFTWVMARRPSVAELWRCIRGGVDSQPPLYDLLERATSGVAIPEIGLRLPSLLAFGCVLLCIYVFVRRRSGGLAGVVAAALAMLSLLYLPYAVEARPYSLVAACVALALVAYQRAPSAVWVAVLALALALGEAFHYYTVFAFAPFAAAEAVHTWQRSAVRFRVWLALVVGAIPLAVSWPLLARFRAIYGANFWAKPDIGAMAGSWGIFQKLPNAWGAALAVVCAVALLVHLRPRADNAPAAPALRGDALLHEKVLVLFLLATPLTVFMATTIMHGGYTHRYFLYGALGIPIAAGLVLPRLGRPTLVLASVLALSALAVQELDFWRHRPALRPDSPAAGIEAMLRRGGNADLPVVVSDPLLFLQLTHYASGPLARRITSLADTTAALRYGNTDSTEQGLIILGTCTPLNVQDFGAFRARNPAFLLYASPGEFGTWWPERLVDDGYRLTVLASGADEVLYQVTR